MRAWLRLVLVLAKVAAGAFFGVVVGAGFVAALVPQPEVVHGVYVLVVGPLLGAVIATAGLVFESRRRPR